MRIGIVGYGGVGKAFVKLIKQKQNLLNKNYNLFMDLICIFDSKGGIYDHNGINLNGLIKFTDDNDELKDFKKRYTDNIDINHIIENKEIDSLIIATPTNLETGEPANTYIKKALENKINVITADKGPILLNYWNLRNLADKNNVRLEIGCTVGGALPSINSGSIDLAGAKIKSIEGILNGTTNYILNNMELYSISYEEALKLAQDLGIAESNPEFDVEGFDTATKLLILTNVLMHKSFSLKDIKISGITKIKTTDIENAAKRNKKYKLIGSAKLINDKLSIEVSLKEVDMSSIFYSVNGKNKAVIYSTDTLGDLAIIGGESGLTAAAASILRDIINMKIL